MNPKEKAQQWLDSNINTETREAIQKMLMDPDEYQRISALRRALAELSPADAMQNLVTQMRKTQNNAEFLMSVKDVK